jgi:hypothetical protein
MPTRTSDDVWMVHSLTSKEGNKGHLELEPGRLVFRPDSTDGETILPLAEIRRFRRVRGTPVLEVVLTSSIERPSRMGFYFVRPPSLDPRPGKRFRAERAARRAAVAQLMSQNREKKAEIHGWMEAIRAAKRS